MANVPAELKYTREHEWAKVEGDRARVGITAFAQEQLGDVVFVELPKVGAEGAPRTQTFGVVESVKAVSDLFAPVIGRGRRGQRRAGQEAGDGEPGSLRPGLDDRGRARQPEGARTSS